MEDNVVGWKDQPPYLTNLYKTRNVTPEKFKVLTGGLNILSCAFEI